MPRHLVVGNQTLGSRELRAALQERDGPDVEVHVVVPQTPLDHYYSPVDGHSETVAEHQLALALRDLADLEATVTGSVGDPDPLMAALLISEDWHPDDVLLSTFPLGVSRWLGAKVHKRLERIVEVPVVLVEAKTFSRERQDAVKYAALRQEMGLTEA